MRSLAAAVTLVAVAVLPAAAPAATPFTAGQGVNPRIAVAANGTGHVVWGIPARGVTPAKVGYCRIPAGASACDRTQELTFPPAAPDPAQSSGNVTVQILPGGKILIAASCFQCGIGGALDTIVRWESTDGGTTINAQPSLGTTPTTAGMGPDGISVTFGAENPYVTPADGQNVVARPVGTGEVLAVTGFTFGYTPSIVQVPGQNKLVWASNDLSQIKTSVYSGPNLGAAAIMTDGNWTKNITLPDAETSNGDTRLNAGPSGVWLTYQNKVPVDDHLGIRRFDPVTNTWSAPRYLESSSVIDAGVDYPSSSQDASGRVHIVWRSLFDTKRLRYTVSDPTGTTFSAPADLAQNEDFFLEPEVAAGPDGKGWAVWTGNGDTPIRVVRIDPYVDPGETPPAPGPSTTPPPAPAPPAARRNVVSTIPGAAITFGVPAACVQPGSTFKVTLSWKRKKKKGNKFVKVTRADFYVGTKVVRVDRRAPFVQTLKVTASARRGSTIRLRARAYIKVRKGKAPKKSIRASIKVCP